MYAIVQTGGKQYKVQPNDVLYVEKLDGDEGQEIAFDQILMVGTESKPVFGTPVVKNAKVTATIMKHLRGPKVLIFKKRRRKNYRRKTGHRQSLTAIKINNITV